MPDKEIEMNGLLGRREDNIMSSAEKGTWEDTEMISEEGRSVARKRLSCYHVAVIIFLTVMTASYLVNRVYVSRERIDSLIDTDEETPKPVTNKKATGTHTENKNKVEGTKHHHHAKMKENDDKKANESQIHGQSDTGIIEGTNSAVDVPLSQENACMDDPNFRFKGDPEKSCSWAAENYVRECIKPQVRNACSSTCGECSVTNDHKRTKHKNGEGADSGSQPDAGTSDQAKVDELQETVVKTEESGKSQKTIIAGVDDSEVYCEDLTKYEKWHTTKITKNDGEMYQVLKQQTHDKDSFTQGLTYARGKLFESAGLYGKSTLRILDPETSTVEKKVPIQTRLFAEGLTYYKDTLVQITWKSQQGFIYNITDLAEIGNFTFETTLNEGWGITWDRCKDEFIVTDGSQNLHFWDPDTMKEKRRVSVKRMDGSDALEMNEIEFWRGRVLANIWYEDVILVIDPETGIVEKEYDFSKLWPRKERRAMKADVLNGISISEDPDKLYITGKLWNRMYTIKLLPEL